MSTIYSTAFVIQELFLMNWDKITYFTNKKIRKNLKVLAAFLINQKIRGQLGFLPGSFFYQNHSIKTMRKPFSQKKKKICKLRFNYSSAESQNQNMHLFKNVQKLNKKKVIWKGLLPHQRPALMRKQPLSYTK